MFVKKKKKLVIHIKMLIELLSKWFNIVNYFENSHLHKQLNIYIF